MSEIESFGVGLGKRKTFPQATPNPNLAYWRLFCSGLSITGGYSAQFPPLFGPQSSKNESSFFKNIKGVFWHINITLCKTRKLSLKKKNGKPYFLHTRDILYYYDVSKLRKNESYNNTSHENNILHNSILQIKTEYGIRGNIFLYYTNTH